MHPAIQQRIDVLDALRQRTQMATADFYALANKAKQPIGPRFKVAPVGRHFFSITDSVTGAIKGWRRTHLEACWLADSLARKVAA